MFESVKRLGWVVGAILLGAVASCGGGGGSESPPTSPSSNFQVSGTVSGVTIAGLVLDDGSDTTPIAAGQTSFSFLSPLHSGAKYDVTVSSFPIGLLCTIANGSGTIGSSDVTNVKVACASDYLPLTGAISGLSSAGLVLSNGSDSVSISPGATSFTLPTNVGYGAQYAVLSQAQPVGLYCTVNSGSGVMPAAGVSGIFVQCVADPHYSSNWAWEGGSTSAYTPGIYNGSQLNPPVANAPGARGGATAWTDAQGKIWIFGGYGDDSTVSNVLDLNDLWKFDPATGEWSWMGGSDVVATGGDYGTLGVPAPGNIPGARDGSAIWQDATGKIWLFGGSGYITSYISVTQPGVAGTLNDFWTFDPITNEWTWVGGTQAAYAQGSYGTLGVAAPSNLPKGRWGSAQWTDNAGNFWLFGGQGFESSSNTVGALNDLWMFSPASGLWTWVNGSNTVDVSSTRSVLGISSPFDQPGSRVGSAHWIDASGNFWLFGGEGQAADGFQSKLGDMWKFDLTSRQWTFMNGSLDSFPNASPGTLGIAAASDTPGAVAYCGFWTDDLGKFWLFDGSNMWKFDPTMNVWTWMRASPTSGVQGIYGTLGVPSPNNIPGLRVVATPFTDSQGRFWLFGGKGYDASGLLGYLNDLWEFQ